jgi:hypothetical protein
VSCFKKLVIENVLRGVYAPNKNELPINVIEKSKVIFNIFKHYFYIPILSIGH